jgi:hypothetical protein
MKNGFNGATTLWASLDVQFEDCKNELTELTKFWLEQFKCKLGADNEFPEPISFSRYFTLPGLGIVHVPRGMNFITSCHFAFSTAI